MSYSGVALAMFGFAWLLVDAWRSSRAAGAPSSPQAAPTGDCRNTLFDAYLLLSDHVQAVGTEEQKAAMLTILPAVAAKEQR